MATSGNFGKEGYLKILYSEDKRPKTDYPYKLAKYLKEKYFFNRTNILDIGCGRGDMLKAFYEIGMEVYGTDISPASKELCKPHDIKIADISKEKLPYEDNSFECIFSKSVIEHLREPDRLFAEANRVLKPGGVFVVMTPSWKHTSWEPFYLDHTHVTPFIKTSLRDAMALSDFSNVSSNYFYQLPFLWEYSALKPLIYLFSKIPLPYRPLNNVQLPLKINNLIRFSKEVMLIAAGNKK